jgi:hypothetical protein
MTGVHSDAVLACIRQHRERFDFELAAQFDAPLELVREIGAKLIASGAIMSCDVTRFENGEPLQARLYRMAGYIPQPSPGRRPRAPV